MPPKKAATKPVEVKETVKEPVKRSTRAARNKRELSEEEEPVVIDTKKKKVADKVPSKQTTAAASKRKKDNLESVELDTKQQPIKRKRIASTTTSTTRQTKSSKVKKDVNDNELNEENDIGEPSEQENEDEPITQKPTARVRSKKTAAAVTTTVDKTNLNEEETAAPVKRPGRTIRSKKPAEIVDTELEETDKLVVSESNDNDDNSKANVRKTRGKKATTTKAINEEPIELPKRTRGRVPKKQIVEEEEEVEPVATLPQEPVTRKVKSKTAASKKVDVVEESTEQQENEESEIESQPLPTTKKTGRGRTKKAPEIKDEEIVTSQPSEPATRRGARSRSKATKEAEVEIPQEIATKPTKSKIRTKKISESQDEDLNKPEPEQVDPQPTEPQVIETAPVDVKLKRGRKATVKRQDSKEQVDNNEAKTSKEQIDVIQETKNQLVEAEVPKTESEQIKKGARGRSKKETINKEQDLPTNKDAEEVESTSKPAPKKGGFRSKKLNQKEDEQVDSEIIESQPIESKTIETQSVEPELVEPIVTDKRSKRIKKIIQNEETEKIVEPIKSTRGRNKKAVVPVVEDKATELEKNKVIDEDDEDDNKSEKELVIDLKDDQPPPTKKRGRKATVKDIVSQETEQPVQQEQVVTTKRRGRNKKQIDSETVSQEVPSIKSNDNNYLPSTEHTEPNKQQSEEIVSTEIKENNEKDSEPPIKRGRLEAVEEVATMEIAPIDTEKPNEIISEEQSSSSKLVDNENNSAAAETSKPTDVSTSSSQDVDRHTGDIIKVIEDMKSFVETSVLEPFYTSSLNETGEVISAKELEEYDSESEELKLTYDTVNFNKSLLNETGISESQSTSSPSTLSFSTVTTTDHESNARKRIKLAGIKDKLELPNIKDGKIVVFGEDVAGELGLAKSGFERHLPAELITNKTDNFCYVNTLSQHSVCINTEGKLYTFGNNDECALGRLTKVDPNQLQDDTDDDNCQDKQEKLNATPTVFQIDHFKAYKATTGDSHTAILTTCGSVFYWGNFRDTNGSIGLSTDQIKPTFEPIAIDPSLDIVDISSGANFLLLLDSYGVVYSLGVGDRGELGRFSNEEECKFNKAERARFLEPKPVEFPKDVKIDGIWSGEFNAFARSTDNRIYSWGLNNYSQLGFRRDNDDDDLIIFKPKEITYFSKLGNRIIKIACGQHHTIALDDRGNLYAFGRHEYGRLGLGKIDKDPKQPKLIESLNGKKVIDISCGMASSFAITDNGELYSWGMASAQLGHGRSKNADDLWEPTVIRPQDKSRIINRFKAIQVAAGSNHCLVLGHLSEDVNNNNHNNGVI